LRGIIPLSVRSYIGALIRNYNRSKGKWLTLAAEEAVDSLRISLKSGYGTLENDGTSYEILFLTKSIDIDLLISNIENISSTILENCASINVIVNENVIIIKEELFKKFPGLQIKVFDENIIFPELDSLRKAISQYNTDRRSWYLQQILKILFVYKQDSPILIIDSDTVIISPLNFLNNSKQLLLVGEGFHFPYSRHTNDFLGSPPFPFSFVNHCQLQLPSVMREIYGENIVESLNHWLALGHSTAEYSCVSEFQTYGDFILRNYPEKVSLFFHEHKLLDLQEFPPNISSETFREIMKQKLMTQTADLVTTANKHLAFPRIFPSLKINI
jgi:hypothetical protein